MHPLSLPTLLESSLKCFVLFVQEFYKCLTFSSQVTLRSLLALTQYHQEYSYSILRFPFVPCFKVCDLALEVLLIQQHLLLQILRQLQVDLLIIFKSQRLFHQ